ncbi:radical SAM/SPASM domain-containing protein [Pelagibaculum spongiae]|uniref:Radical SAM/SPASM domain-containing protein n=1 Tax=Pelagibaculum spongiae TaxID=2080658 RepID=A0A2V1GS78_9GAMM|nr:radical SAM/SPASM domain-containing protein [Pelagibaculum spongiae]
MHLLYVPTIYCNLGCRYCYLGKQTDQSLLKKDFGRALSTLQEGVDKFQKAGYTPFNISLHGGEVTTLPGHVLNDLFSYIKNYYQREKEVLNRHGFKKNHPHIKTNLYNFDKHYDLMQEQHVSISASLDLPLFLHDKYRVTKKGGSTLKRTLSNIRLLADYPYNKKMSAVIYAEHLQYVDEIIKDIWYLHQQVGIDMNNFNFMFGFESLDNAEKYLGEENLETKAVSDQDQVSFYQQLKSAFTGTELEPGFHKHWFDEFTPNYCTNAFNCGEKFFLLQSDGDIFSCVRGQGSAPFHYGNIFNDSIESIMEIASQNISNVHRAQGLHEDCKQCEYLSTCHTGCAYVKHEQQSAKSYTCALQKEIYRNYPALYPATPQAEKKEAVTVYTVDMHPHLISSDLIPDRKRIILPNDLYDPGNSLFDLIMADETLQSLYSSEQVKLSVNGAFIDLQSQILKSSRDILTLCATDDIAIHIHKNFLQAACADSIRNTLHLQLLKDTPVIYGDEQRTKQAHTYTLEVFSDQLQHSNLNQPGTLSFDLKPFLALSTHAFEDSVINNLLVTTHFLRRYHYEKQRNNAFYHIQAINLPFQNIEFYWIKE